MDWLIGEELFLFQMAMAESEKKWIQKQNEKNDLAQVEYAVAKRGRPPKMTLGQFVYLYEKELKLFFTDETCIDCDSFCKKYKIGRSLFYKYKKEMNQKS